MLAAALILLAATSEPPINVVGHAWAPFISPMGEPFRPRDASDDTLARWFSQADRNHDGQLTPDEMRADADRFFATLDSDGDGVIDALDSDSDNDGLPDHIEADNKPGSKNPCAAPLDSDDSGIPDYRDKDSDGDGILDAEDACPADAGPRNDDPARNGCPVVRIEAGQIRIREQVKFKTASSQILKESDYILQAVVKILQEHPEITKVRVEGHTDTRGKPGYNKKLSQRRAASVVKWLVKHGISKQRLTSEGYGQERPIATNMTEEGRHQNRRVEFHIVEGPGGEKTP